MGSGVSSRKGGKPASCTTAVELHDARELSLSSLGKSASSSSFTKSTADTADGPRYQAPENAKGTLTVLSWNIAAVNNNPFEYWIDFKDPLYEELMFGVECFLDHPGEHDVPVSEIFTEQMFQDLKARCEDAGLNMEEVEKDMWRKDLSKRRVVSEYLKDISLGDKRLISMPDRVTNTVNVVHILDAEKLPEPVCRPCVINNYEGDLSSKEKWWEQWKHFMFDEELRVRTRSGAQARKPIDMLEPIPRTKYPAVTEQEERLAIPLQVVCLAIFDAIIVDFMNKLSPDGKWQRVKAQICDRLYRNKHKQTMQILSDRYSVVDIICLQEVAAVFRDGYQASQLAETHELILPLKLDGKRDQNSVMLLKKDAFAAPSVAEVTALIVSLMPEGTRLSEGDLLAVQAHGLRDNRNYLLASFHGDTNGLMTLPLVHALDEAIKTRFRDHTLILSLDANLSREAVAGKQDFAGFMDEIQTLGFKTCWGDSPDVSRCLTTCIARTSLQPQLNKACRQAEKSVKSDKNPKDMILFYRQQLDMIPTGKQPNPLKDNTGHLFYKEDSVFPSIDFPSDHGIIVAALRLL